VRPSPPFATTNPALGIVWSALLLLGTVLRLTAAADLAKAEGVTAEPAKHRFIFAAARPVAVTEVVELRRELSSVGTFVIADGTDATDVRFDGGLAETGGACGFAKEGLGTLRIAGRLEVSGFITVYEGVLDLAAARPTKPLRVNLLGSARLIPPDDARPHEIHLNGERLKPGVWGPVGLAPNGSPALLGRVLVAAPSTPTRRETWQGLKYGIFSHYVWNGYGMTAGLPNADGSRAKSIDELADNFDVDDYVNQLVEAGAQYVVFTAWHSGTCPLFPSAAMKKWAPGRRSSPKRDLLGDLLDACRKRGVRPFFYCHPYQPVANPHNDWINDLFAELVDRYGDRLDGLWLDENFQDCTQDKVVDYPRLMRTIKERNPELVLTHNNGGYQTYGTDEGVQEVQWEYHLGRASSAYMIFHNTAKSPEDMLITTVIQAAANTLGGGIQWSIDAHGYGGAKRGGLDATARPILDPFIKLFKPIAESVRETRPSTSFPPPFRGANVTLGGLSWGVATKSADDRREYLHVLKAPQGSTLRLPAPADGKVFGEARLLDGGQKLMLQQSNRGLVLTLPEGVEWRKPDTVIVLDVVAPGGVGLVNNTSRAFGYFGASWKYQRDIATGDFRCDRHVATVDGDGFTFTFEGTDFAWLGAPSTENVRIELALDGVKLGAMDLTPDRANPRILFAKQGLARGRHTLAVTKRGGASLTLDAFRVSDLINDADPEMMFETTTRHGANSARLEGPWEPRGGSWINGQRFTFEFHGTELEVLGGSAHGSGDLVLSVDDGKPLTVHCHGGQATRSLARFDRLANARHKVVGYYANRHPAGFIAALDGFVVTRPDYWSQQKRRGLGELGDDAHVSTLRNATGRLKFQGSGVEVYATRDPASRTAHYGLDGKGSSLWIGLSHYAPVVVAGTPVLRQLNLAPGKHTVSFTHGANTSGVNFSSAHLVIDAVRVHKGESSSASPLFWGADARGGSGVWDLDTSANWHDGAAVAKWQDFGADDHLAVFGGRGGEITLAAPMRANRLVFHTGGYKLRGEALELTGVKPSVQLNGLIRVVFAMAVRLPDGKTLPPGTYTAASRPDLISGAGSLVIEAPAK
jgi:hypothetical protein